MEARTASRRGGVHKDEPAGKRGGGGNPIRPERGKSDISLSFDTQIAALACFHNRRWTRAARVLRTEGADDSSEVRWRVIDIACSPPGRRGHLQRGTLTPLPSGFTRHFQPTSPLLVLPQSYPRDHRWLCCLGAAATTEQELRIRIRTLIHAKP